jgi:hypothetical protein
MKILKTALLLFAFVQLSVFAIDEQEDIVGNIAKETEDYICERVENVVNSRYDWISSPRVWWDVIISSNESRRNDWIEHFEEEGISKDGIQDFINEKVEEYNSKHNQKINQTSLSKIDIVDDASFELIIKRERYEIFCWLGTILLGALAGAIIGGIIGYFINIESEEDFPILGIRFIQLVAIGIGLYLSNILLTPIEISISNSIIENIFQQLSDMNTFEQL